MTSLSMKTYPALFCGIFTLLFLGVRSENSLNAPVSSVQTPAEVTAPHAVPPLNSTDKTRNASEKPFAHSVSASGTERPTHNETPSIMTTASEKRVNVTEEAKSQEEKSTVLPKTEASTSPVKTSTLTVPALTSGQQPTANNSTMTTMLLKTDPQTAANTTAKAPMPPALTTSFTATTNNSMSTVLPQNSSKGSATSSATTAKHLQNTTNKVFNKSTAITEDPASSVNVTTGSVLENNKTFSATPETLVENQSTTRAHIRTTAFSNDLTTTAKIPSTNTSTSVATNATQGGGIHVITKILSTSTATTTKVTEPVQNTEAQPCSSIVVAKRCLIVIASLAAVATIFIVATIVLCTKLSSRKYRLRRQQQGTEMMCISSLMPERSSHQRIRYTRQRSPVPNGVLVIPNCDDSDDDNLTLSSFLAENDRYV